MRRFAIACACAALAATVAFAADKQPTTIRLKADDVTAEIVFEKGGKISVTSKPTPIKPGEYFVKSLSVFKKDAKGKVWEMRAIPSALETLSMVAVEAEQDKVLLLGSRITAHVTGEPAAGKDVKFYIKFIGSVSSEMYIPGAFCEGKAPPAPAVTAKDMDGKVVASGPLTVNDAGTHVFTGKLTPGFTGKITVAVDAVMGPFELVQTERKIVIP